MTYNFKQDSYGWGDTFYIYDENNHRAFYVKSSIALWNRKFEIYDLNRNLIAVIKKEPKSIVKKQYHILIHDKHTATVTKEISLIPKYTFEGLNWEMRGVMQHEYDMLQQGAEVLSFHRQATDWGLRPVLEIHDPSNELLALSVVLTISYVMNAKEDGTPTDHI